MAAGTRRRRAGAAGTCSPHPGLGVGAHREPEKVAGAGGPERGWAPARPRGLVPVLLWQLLALLSRGAAVYLEVRELEEKCFIQEIPEGTVVIGARGRGAGRGGGDAAVERRAGEKRELGSPGGKGTPGAPRVPGRPLCASPGKYRAELYDPVGAKFQPAPQWINLFVLVKDPENRVRPALTRGTLPVLRPDPCTPTPAPNPAPLPPRPDPAPELSLAPFPPRSPRGDALFANWCVVEAEP